MKAGPTLFSALLVLALEAGAATTLRPDSNAVGVSSARASDALQTKLAWHAAYARSAMFDAEPALLAVNDKPTVLDDSGRATQSSGSALSDRASQVARSVQTAGVISHVPSRAENMGSIPEPGRWAMLFAGLLGVGAIVRRRSAF